MDEEEIAEAEEMECATTGEMDKVTADERKLGACAPLTQKKKKGYQNNAHTS